jgi:hypothetical protein
VADVDEAERERLYGLPLERFTEERDALAKQLRQDGRRDEADAVKKLPKPSVPAWTVNRLARARSKDVARLLEAASSMRQSPGEAAGAFRSAVDDLVHEARELLERERGSASDAVVQRVETTLRAGAAGADADRDALLRGVLATELEPAGFEAMAGVSPAPARPAGKAAPRPKPTDAAARRKRVERAKAAVSEARDRARALRRTAEEAERAARRARTEADRADSAVTRAEEELAQARAGD